MVYVFLADGFEELEALAPVDILRRAKIEVKTVGVTGKTVFGSHKTPVVCDLTVDEALILNDIKAVVLPGGMPGTLNLQKNEKVNAFIDFAVDNNLVLGAICAAPSILGRKGILKGKNATCFTGFEKDLLGANVLNNAVVRDGNIITAFGAGAAFQFGFMLLEVLESKETSENIRKSMRFGE